jgi:hypothetical protein
VGDVRVKLGVDESRPMSIRRRGQRNHKTDDLREVEAEWRDASGVTTGIFGPRGWE